MRRSTDIGRFSTGSTQERTGLIGTSHRSYDSISSSRDISDQSNPKTPEEYIRLIRDNRRYLTTNEQRRALHAHEGSIHALQEAQRSKLESPIAQAFLGFIMRDTLNKDTQAVVDSLKKTLMKITERKDFITVQLENHNRQVKLIKEWVTNNFGEQLDQLPEQLQYIKGGWEQTHREVSSHQGDLLRSVESAQCHEDIIRAQDDNIKLIRHLGDIQLNMLYTTDPVWYEQTRVENDKIVKIDRESDDRINRIEELTKQLDTERARSLWDKFMNAVVYKKNLARKSDESLVLASTAESSDLVQKTNCLLTLKDDAEKYTKLLEHLDGLLTQYSK